MQTEKDTMKPEDATQQKAVVVRPSPHCSACCGDLLQTKGNEDGTRLSQCAACKSEFIGITVEQFVVQCEIQGWEDVHGGRPQGGMYWRGINPNTRRVEPLPLPLQNADSKGSGSPSCCAASHIFDGKDRTGYCSYCIYSMEYRDSIEWSEHCAGCKWTDEKPNWTPQPHSLHNVKGQSPTAEGEDLNTNKY